MEAFPYGLIAGLESYLNRNIGYFGHWNVRSKGTDAIFTLETFVPGKGVVKSIARYEIRPNLTAVIYNPIGSENAVLDFRSAIRTGFEFFHWMVE
jgi:hypothetical protein